MYFNVEKEDRKVFQVIPSDEKIIIKIYLSIFFVKGIETEKYNKKVKNFLSFDLDSRSKENKVSKLLTAHSIIIVEAKGSKL